MSIYVRGPFWWAEIEGAVPRKRVPLGIRVKGATPQQTKANKKLALAAYNVLCAQQVSDRFGLPTDEPGVTFVTQADWYETHHTATHAGPVREGYTLNRLRAFFGRMPLGTIGPNRWQEYKTQRLKEGVVASTVTRELNVAKLVLASAVGEHIEFSPLAGVRGKKVRQPAKRTITGAEEPALLDALKDRDRELHDLYVVGVGSLLRQSNLIHLQRKDYRGTHLVVALTKTGPHQVPLTGLPELHERAAKVLRDRMPGTHTGAFFPKWQTEFDSYDERANPSIRFARQFRYACRDVGIPWGLTNGGVVWHSGTRASGATRMMREYGIDIRTVQLLGPWSSLDQMATYLGIRGDLAQFDPEGRVMAERDALHILLGTHVRRIDAKDHAPLRVGKQVWTVHDLATKLGVTHVAAARKLSAVVQEFGATSVADLYKRSSPFTFAGVKGLGDTTLYVLWQLFRSAGLDPEAWATPDTEDDTLVSFASLKNRERKREAEVSIKKRKNSR